MGAPSSSSSDAAKDSPDAKAAVNLEVNLDKHGFHADREAIKAKALASAVTAGQIPADANPNDFAVSPDGTLISLSGKAGDLVSAGQGATIPFRGGQVWNRDDWFKMKDESWGRYSWRLMFEGHTVFDAFLTAACGQIGQIMLASPAALFKAGVISGGITMVWSILIGFWTVWNFVSLYLEFKRDKIRDGSWWDTNGEHRFVAQWFDVVGHHLGPIFKYAAWFFIVLSTTGTCMVQTVASATSMYTIDDSRSKREWSLIFGGSMVFLVLFFPRFTKFRLLNIIGLVGTAYVAIYALDMARKHGKSGSIQWFPPTPEVKPGTTPAQNWFNGMTILIAEVGAHALIIESMEAMEQPAHYKKAYVGGITYILFVVIPHTFALNFSYGSALNKAENMYALFPTDNIKRASVILMIIHQYIAYLLYGTLVCIAVEKVVGTHTKPMWIRALTRLPLALFWWFLAMICPFYGSINSLMTSLGSTVVSFSFLAIASIKIYWTKERRDAAVFAPFKWLQWKNWLIVHAINAHIAIFYTGFGAASLYYAILQIQQSYHTWGWLPECYLCPAKVAPKPVLPIAAFNSTLAG